MRGAIYTRVSTDFGEDDPRHQDCQNQVDELEQFAASQGWEITRRYEDRVSGAKGRDKRPDFSRMLDDAARRRFDILLVWSADRLSRQGPYETLRAVKQLSSYGVRFRSLQQPFLDTTNPLFGEFLLAMYGWMASEERRLISERTRAGLDRARRKGKKLGRPTVTQVRKRGGVMLAPVDVGVLHALRSQGASLRQIAKSTGASLASVHALCSKNGSKTHQLSLVDSKPIIASCTVQ
jgi:DNA invertase Pin-like site-specific DNA recombinase